MRVPEDADRDFVAGAFIIRDEEILFLNHKKLDMWLMPGGHVEEGETPDETAVRETLEETGFEIEVMGDDRRFEGFSAIDIPDPFNINLHEIEEGHWHCDFQYIAEIKDRVKDYEYSDENIKWLSEDEIRSGEYEIPENVCKSALKVLKS